MRVPLEWLADYVAVELSTDELAHLLTMGGLKVESIERIGADWQDVVIGEVIEIQPHPRSNKPLSVAKVDLGAETITVVTGAQNVRLGDKAPVVRVGGLLPQGPDGGPMTIERRPMAGITSEGMLASERELGVSDEHTGIMILPRDAPVGLSLRAYMGGDVLDIETNPNRPDTLSIIGVAREVAALTGGHVTLPDLDAITGNVTWLDEQSIEIQVVDAELCPRYSALRIDGLRHGASPTWMARRLREAGMRPINLIVDITNYVMLEYGQPMHAFDARRLRGGKIVVRPAHDGEQMRTLDGVDRTFSPENLMIVDGHRAVAVAGVMGGENSEVTDGTTTIVLESATFDAVSVRRTAKALGLRTEASSRFEKGLSPETTEMGAMRFLQLLAQTGGTALRVASMSDAWLGPPPQREVVMPMRDLHRLVGVNIPEARAAEVLSLLGFEVAVRGDSLAATVPFWRRVDIEQSADLVEEVARVVGFDHIPATLPRRTLPPPAIQPERRWEDRIRDCMLRIGLSEATTHSLTSPEAMTRLFPPVTDGHEIDDPEMWAQLIPNAAGVYAREALTLPVRLANPSTRDRQMLRVTAVPSLLDILGHNLKHTEEHLAFFELSRVPFWREHDLPYERRTLTVALTGVRRPRNWGDKTPGPYTFYDVKGAIEVILDAMGIHNWTIEPRPHPALHPGRSAVIQLAGHSVAYLGELHPEVAARFELDSWPAQVAEIDFDSLVAAAGDTRIFREIPRYPAAYRDIAVVIDGSVPAARVMRVVQDAGSGILESARIFDLYRGEPLSPDQKSVAIGLSFRAPGATLAQEEINDAVSNIVSALQSSVGATLRK